MCINELRKLGSVTENYLSTTLKHKEDTRREKKLKTHERPQDLSTCLFGLHTLPMTNLNSSSLTTHKHGLPLSFSLPFSRSKQASSRESKVGLTRQKDSSASAATTRGSGEEKRGEDGGWR